MLSPMHIIVRPRDAALDPESQTTLVLPPVNSGAIVTLNQPQQLPGTFQPQFSLFSGPPAQQSGPYSQAQVSGPGNGSQFQHAAHHTGASLFGNDFAIEPSGDPMAIMGFDTGMIHDFNQPQISGGNWNVMPHEMTDAEQQPWMMGFNS